MLIYSICSTIAYCFCHFCNFPHFIKSAAAAALAGAELYDHKNSAFQQLKAISCVAVDVIIIFLPSLLFILVFGVFPIIYIRLY